MIIYFQQPWKNQRKTHVKHTIHVVLVVTLREVTAKYRIGKRNVKPIKSFQCKLLNSYSPTE